MKANVNVTISKNSNDKINLRVKDSLSRVEFVDVEFTLEDYAKLITGLAEVQAIGELRGLQNVGKKRVSERRSAQAPHLGYGKEKYREWLLDNCQEEGWTIDSYLGEQSSIVWGSYGKSVTLNYRVTKYVEVGEETKS